MPPMGILGDGRPRFSPDGSRLAFLRAVAEGAEDVYVMRLTPDGGAAARRVTAEGRAIGSFGWMPSGEELLLSVTRRETARSLWRTRLSDGSMRRIAEAGIGPLTPFASWKGGRIAWATIVRDTNIWRLSLDGSAPGRRPSPRRRRRRYQPADLSRRAISGVSRGNRTGFSEIWIW